MTMQYRIDLDMNQVPRLGALPIEDDRDSPDEGWFPTPEEALAGYKRSTAYERAAACLKFQQACLVDGWACGLRIVDGALVQPEDRY